MIGWSGAAGLFLVFLFGQRFLVLGLGGWTETDGLTGKSTGTDGGQLSSAQLTHTCTSGRVRPLRGGKIGLMRQGCCEGAAGDGLASVYRLFGSRRREVECQGCLCLAWEHRTRLGRRTACLPNHVRRRLITPSLAPGEGREMDGWAFPFLDPLGGPLFLGGEGWAGRDCMTHGFGWLGGYSTGQG
jgi:hypothetical protein